MSANGLMYQRDFPDKGGRYSLRCEGCAATGSVPNAAYRLNCCEAYCETILARLDDAFVFATKPHETLLDAYDPSVDLVYHEDYDSRAELGSIERRSYGPKVRQEINVLSPQHRPFLPDHGSDLISVKLFLVWREDVPAAVLDVQRRFNAFLDERKGVPLPPAREVEKPIVETQGSVSPFLPRAPVAERRAQRSGGGFAQWLMRVLGWGRK